MYRIIFAVLFVLGLSIPDARATILYAGGEDIDTVFVGSVSITTTSTQFRSGYARAALQLTAGAGDPPTNRIQTGTFTNTTSLWFHFENIAGTNTSTSNDQAIRIFGSDGNPAIVVRGTGTAGQVKISTRNTAGTFADLVTCTSGAWPLSALNKVDIFLNYAVSGQVTMYVNGAQICTFSGDVTTNSRTAVNAVELAGPGSATAISWSEIIISTTDTRNLNLVTLAPVANGNTMAWTGVVGSVNEITINDTANINTGTSNLLAQFTIGSLPAGVFNISAVKQIARVQIGATGPQNFSFSERPGSGSSDFTSCSTAGTTSFVNYSCYLATNPATSAAWVTGDLGTGTNFGLKSLP